MVPGASILISLDFLLHEDSLLLGSDLLSLLHKLVNSLLVVHGRTAEPTILRSTYQILCQSYYSIGSNWMHAYNFFRSLCIINLNRQMNITWQLLRPEHNYGGIPCFCFWPFLLKILYHHSLGDSRSQTRATCFALTNKSHRTLVIQALQQCALVIDYCLANFI